MSKLDEKFAAIDNALVKWMKNHGITWLRISIGIIFLWFGILKFFPGMSPAEDFALATIRKITFGLLNDQSLIYSLASLETLIGAGLLLNMFMRFTLLLLFLQLAGTFLPIVIFPKDVFNIFPFSLTLEGQYIVKNLIVVCAGIVIGSTVKRKKW